MYVDAYGNYPDLRDVKKILVVKLRHLGDVLLASPVFTALKKSAPEASIDAFIWSESTPMLEGHPAIDRLIGYDRDWKKQGVKRWFKEARLFWDIRQQKYDLIINLTEGDRGAFTAKISGAKIRVGIESKRKSAYTHLVKSCPGLRHTVERNLDALRRIGIFPKLEDRALFLHVPEGAIHSVQKWVGTDPFVLIHPASRWRFKCLPVEKMRSLVRSLIERGEDVVLTSGSDPVERAMVGQIAEGLDVLNLSGKISLKELAALIKLTKTLICVDSVPLHMASALKTPVLAIFGPTSEVTWGPWQNGLAQIVTEPVSCRPCYQDGCGGSKVSDCLHSLPLAKVLTAYDALQEKRCLSS